MASGNGYFQHDRSVIDFAYSLVKEYDDHEKVQDRIYRRAHPYVPQSPKNRSKQGGMIVAGTRKQKREKEKYNYHDA